MCDVPVVRWVVLGIVGILSGVAGSAAQPWMQSVPESQRDNFYTIQKSFNEFWKDKDTREKGKGWKQFKRWEWFWEQRVFPDGRFPDPMHLYHETTREAGRRVRHADRFAGSWTEMGPYDSPGG